MVYLNNIDCHAIILAEFMAKKYNHEILGLTTSYGNSKLEHTTRNAQIALNMVDSNVPIYKGC
jgi:inosine-uridine nucleoside N-ribohydrolase